MVATSNCEFYRNGTWYRHAQAEAHLRRKWQYFSAHASVGTAEEFIEKVASKSTFTGMPYRIRCGTAPEVLADAWFLAALQEMRRCDDIAYHCGPSAAEDSSGHP